MIRAHRIRPNEYRDSGSLMTLAARLQEQPGILRAAAIMATPRNVELLTAMHFVESAPACAPADLLVVVEAESREAADAALARIDALLVRGTTTTASRGVVAPRPRTLERAFDGHNLALISVPGPFAAREARRALRAGLHVFLFSNGVSLADEVALKQEARERGLLVMGPDCGTAIIDGVPIGFANRVRRGSIGIVGASGTGIQEVSTLVHRLGGGISHAIGTGSKDLSDAVGGISTLQGIEMLARDAATETIVIVSKPPSPAVAARVLEAARATGKRIVTAFVGGATTLEDAAFEACGLAPEVASGSTLDPSHVVGLFSGGTLASEARTLLEPGAEILDLGEEEYTRGRPHPMIDPSIRVERIAALDAEAVLLLDVVLGEGAHPDPAGALIEAISARGGVTIASVCGTELDPQQRETQVQKLRDAGVLVARSNAAAARGLDLPLPTIASMPPAVASTPLFGKPLAAINLGLDSFADTLEVHGIAVARIDWRPPAGGDEELARILDRLL